MKGSQIIAFTAVVAVAICLSGPQTKAPPAPASRGHDDAGPLEERKFYTDLHPPLGPDYSQEEFAKVWSAIRALPSEPEYSAQLVDSWQPIGPFGMMNADFGMYSGRILDIELGPPFRVAAASGGLELTGSVDT